jgi:hypothetical protein
LLHFTLYFCSFVLIVKNSRYSVRIVFQNIIYVNNTAALTNMVLFQLKLSTMRTGSNLNRLFSNFSLLCFLNFGLTLAGQSPIISDIPGQVINEGQVFATINLNAFVEDPDNKRSELTWSLLEEDVDLLVSIENDSMATFLPMGDWNGTDTITFIVRDPGFNTDSDTAVFKVLPVNDPPVVGDIPDQEINEGGLFDPISLDSYVTDIDNTPDQLDWSVSGNSNLDVVITDDSHIASITPHLNWTGEESIVFTATDLSTGSGSDDALFTLTALAGAPSDITLSPSSVAENQSLNTLVGTLSTDDPDVGDTFIYSFGSGLGDSDNGSFNIVGSTITTKATFDFETKSSYSVLIRSTGVEDGLWFEKAIIITITNVNDPPVVIDIPNQTIAEDGSFATINLDNYVSDPDHADNQLIWTYSGNSQLTVSISGSRVATITTPANWNGTETITFTATDPLGGNNSDPATFTATPVNDPPVVTDIPNQTIAEDGSFATINLDNFVSDPDHADNQLIWTYSGNSQLTVSISGSRVATITTPANWNGSETITFIATDPLGGTDSDPALFTVTPVNDPPIASGVGINTADARIGIVNTGVYTFSDPDGDGPGTHTYKWYRSDYSSGVPATAITGATSLTYTPVIADGGKWICFEITPVDEYGLAGTPLKSAFKYINALPVASNAQVYAPLIQPGETIKGRFTYADAEGNPRGNANYQWYRSTAVNPTPGSPGNLIGSDSAYVLKNADAGKYLWFRVEPVATAGSTPGVAIWSNVIGPIGEFSANITGSGTFCTGATMPITLTITAGKAPYSAIIRRSASTSDKDTTITAIAASPRNIQVKIPGNYVLISLTDANLDEATCSATPVILVINPKPKAILTGTAAICDDGTSRAGLSLNFTSGTGPWSVTVRRRENPANDTTFTNVTSDPFLFNARVIGSTPTRHRVIAINDANGCTGDTASGSAWVSYKTSPTAVISGIDSICPGGNALLSIVFTGTGPWDITYMKNGILQDPVTNISNFSYTLQVPATGTYTLASVYDHALFCTGRVSGTGIVRAYAVPTALISGTATICEHASANLNVALTGNADWKFSYRLDGGTPVEVPNIHSSPKTVSVKQGGTYTLYEVYDKNCKGTVSGSAVITVTPAPLNVTLSGLAPAYNIASSEIVPISGTPSGGNFTGPGLLYNNPNWFFFPPLAHVGTHNIIYSWRASPGSCYGYDTAVVRVLEANALIEFGNDRVNYCTNDLPFTVTGVNLADVIGSFTIEGGVGLVDHHNNTATIYPSQLGINQYTITYTYYDGTTLSVTDNFNIGNKPAANFIWESECYQAGQSISFKNTSTSTFGNLTDTSYHWKVYTATGFVPYTTRNVIHTFPQAGNYKIELQLQNTYGCTATITKALPLRPTIALAGHVFEENFETNPIEWQSDSLPTIAVNSWELGTPSKHGIPLRGFSGAKSGVNCWYTNITTNTAPLEQSWISSPCFDFTDTEKPMLIMNIWRLFNDDRDGANLQASSDSGKTWLPIGQQLNDGVNWFNTYYGNPGAQSMGWSGIKDAGWIESRHTLDVLKNKSRVQFRIAYGAIGTAIGNDGIAFDNFQIVERNRTALIEHFTNSSCEKCDSVDSVVDDFVNNHGLNAIDIQYHTSYPPDDPFYKDNNSFTPARAFYYGLSGVPYSILDGGSTSQQRFDHVVKLFDKNAIIAESLSDSKFEMNINSQVLGSTLKVEVQVSPRVEIPETGLSIHIALIERVIKGVTGSNGDTLFESVVKDMLPDAAGTPINKAWSPGESHYIEQQLNLQDIHLYDPAGTELRVVAFIQNINTNEVYQAYMDTIGVYTGIDNPLPGSPAEKSFIVYPNPADRSAHILFNKETEEDITIELFNNLGGLVYKRSIPEGTNMTDIPVENYPDGLYIIRLVSSNKLIGINKLTISK